MSKLTLKIKNISGSNIHALYRCDIHVDVVGQNEIQVEMILT